MLVDGESFAPLAQLRQLHHGGMEQLDAHDHGYAQNTGSEGKEDGVRALLPGACLPGSYLPRASTDSGSIAHDTRGRIIGLLFLPIQLQYLDLQCHHHHLVDAVLPSIS